MRDDIIAFLKASGIKEPTELQITCFGLMAQAQRSEIEILLNRVHRPGKSQIAEITRRAAETYAVTNQKP